MTQLDAWRRWAIDLDHDGFAAAYAALGAASAYRRAGAMQPYGYGGYEDAAPDRQLAAAALACAGEPTHALRWLAPTPGDPALVHAAPAQWRDAWRDFARERGGAAVGLELWWMPDDEPIEPSRRTLARALAPDASLRLALFLANASLHLDWPLRAHALDSGSQRALAAAAHLAPSDALLRASGPDHETTHCDVLLARGDLRALLRALVARRAAPRANLVVFAGAIEGTWGAAQGRLAAVLAETRASGFVCVPGELEPALLGDALNRLVIELSHAMPVAVAVARSFGALTAQRALVGLTAAFALTDLRAVVARTAGDLDAIARAAPDRGDDADFAAAKDWLARIPPPADDAPMTGYGAQAAQRSMQQSYEPHRALGDRDVHDGRRLESADGDVDYGRELGAYPEPPVASPAYEPEPAAPASMPPPVAAPVPSPSSGVPIPPARLPPASLPPVPIVPARPLDPPPGYDHESDAARALAQARKHAHATERAVAARWLQAKSFVRLDGRDALAAHGFVVHEPAIVRVRIGLPDEAWASAATPFAEHLLPRTSTRWTLRIWLTEPEQLEAPIAAEIILPSTGDSSAAELQFRPRRAGRFEGRISVLHRGRVLQTAVLVARVLARGEAGTPEGAPRFSELVPVRAQLAALSERRPFDLAFVLNHDARGRALGNALAADHAWLVDLDPAIAVAKEINKALSKVAVSERDYRDGFAGEAGRALLVQLAKCGGLLHLRLVDQQIADAGNRPDIAAHEYVQIVTTRTDKCVPFEFIYDYEVPRDEAPLCPRWRDALAAGACPETCAKTTDTVCPMGFWGLSKVIERHAHAPGLRRAGIEAALQSEPDAQRKTLKFGGAVVYGSSERVKKAQLDVLGGRLAERHLAGERADDWDAWKALVAAKRPAFLVALPHTDGRGVNASLELGGEAIDSIQLTDGHVRASSADAPPLVALLGCDVAATADEYADHVVVFRTRGAAVVIGTIATVFGEHAVTVAGRLVDALAGDADAAPRRLGEALRAIKRAAVAEGLLMPLCLVAYGDADWLIER